MIAIERPGERKHPGASAARGTRSPRRSDPQHLRNVGAVHPFTWAMSVFRLRFASRVSVATLAVCALATAPAAAGWETIGITSYAGTVVSDGLRLVAFQSEDRHVTVLDAEHGSVTRHRIPDDCSPGGFPSLRSVGGGRVLVWCWSPARPWHLLLLDPASDRWEEVPGLADDPQQRSTGDVSFDALGAHWLRRTIGSRSGLRRTWIDWRTGEQRTDASDPRVVPDPDLAQLYVVPCEDMELPNPLPRALPDAVWARVDRPPAREALWPDGLAACRPCRLGRRGTAGRGDRQLGDQCLPHRVPGRVVVAFRHRPKARPCRTDACLDAPSTPTAGARRRHAARAAGGVPAWSRCAVPRCPRGWRSHGASAS
jgi:hypothetical protein